MDIHSHFADFAGKRFVFWRRKSLEKYFFTISKQYFSNIPIYEMLKTRLKVWKSPLFKGIFQPTYSWKFNLTKKFCYNELTRLDPPNESRLLFSRKTVYSFLWIYILKGARQNMFQNTVHVDPPVSTLAGLFLHLMSVEMFLSWHNSRASQDHPPSSRKKK